jgi:hypothetical protein
MRNRFWLGLTGLVAVLALTLLLPNCGRAQVLASIDVQPDVETFGDANTPVSADAGLNVQLRALGNYAHPPITKDITSKVTWASNTPGIATVDATGLLTATGTDCGDAIVSATVQNNTDGNESASGAIVTGSMTATVVCFSTTGHVEPQKPASAGSTTHR